MIYIASCCVINVKKLFLPENIPLMYIKDTEGELDNFS